MGLTPEQLILAVGRRIAEIRESKEMTQWQLAEILDVSGKYTRMIEAGNANLTLRSVARIASALEIEVAELFVAPKTTTKRNPGRPPNQKRG